MNRQKYFREEARSELFRRRQIRADNRGSAIVCVELQLKLLDLTGVYSESLSDARSIIGVALIEMRDLTKLDFAACILEMSDYVSDEQRFLCVCENAIESARLFVIVVMALGMSIDCAFKRVRMLALMRIFFDSVVTVRLIVDARAAVPVEPHRSVALMIADSRRVRTVDWKQ